MTQELREEAKQTMMPWASEAVPDVAVELADSPDLFGDDGGMLVETLKGIHNVTSPDKLHEDLPHANPPANMTITKIGKAQDGATPQATNQDVDYMYTYMGIAHPVDYIKVKTLKDISAHHSSCIQAKLNATVGLGFISESKEPQKKVEDPNASPEEVAQAVQSLLTGENYVESEVDTKLNPLTLHGFQNELFAWVEDFLDTGTAYLEVVRDDSGKIVGINWLPVEDLYVYLVQDDKTGRGFIFYRYIGSSVGTMTGFDRYFSLFGKRNKDLVEKLFHGGTGATLSRVSEVIPLQRPTNRSKYYGYPDWLSAAPVIDLLRRAMQYKSDWFTNRGVLDYILHFAGGMDDPEWQKIVRFIQQTVGAGKNFKSLAFKSRAEATSTLHKLAGENGKEDQFYKDLETFSQFIVSAHRVPPVLANILIPGKLGASNETIQALVAFQLLSAGPSQKNIERTLARTLGGDDGIDGLKAESFRLVPITSQFNITGMESVGSSRSEAMDGDKNQDRDYSEGPKE